MMEEEDLIPGLPEEIARECLIRVPYELFRTARSVSKLWNQELDSPDFHRIRKSSGLTRPIIIFSQSDHIKTTSSYRLSLYDPFTGTWHSLPPIPGLLNGLPFFCRIVTVGRNLVVVGGWDPQTCIASDCVYVYDFGADAWRRGARMPGPRRSFFACAASAEEYVVFVAGGHDERKNALTSALAYDVARDEWAPLPDMERERDECRGVFLRGRFHVVGGYSTEAQGRFRTCAEAFDCDTWKWGPVEEDVLEVDTCPMTCVACDDDGLRRLYMCREGRVAVREGSTWRDVVALPDDVRVAALQMVGWEGGLMVIKGGAQVGYILEGMMTWRKVEMPPEYWGHIQAGCSIQI